ncbi:MAG: hypothetical protein QGH37_22235, partial [Candidatus Poribacteria bacterium]|nr:hypothetical protein [Candidatus Poribacteria bacterium]
QETFIWWEGETPTETNFPAQTSFSATTFRSKSNLLSNNRWLTNEGKRTGEEAFARYKLNITHAGAYHLWVRKFWKHGPFKWRFDQDVWRICGRDITLADNVTIRTHLVANWVYLGEIHLTKGERIFELRLLADIGQPLTSCFDVFVLTPNLFKPNGKLKPGEKYGKADQGFFPFEPDMDDFRTDAILDLRKLNESIAGQDGFIQRKRANLVLGNGEVVRFWGVNLNGNNAGGNRSLVDYLARKLAKIGVNMARYHSPIFNIGPRPEIVDPKRLDDLFYLVKTLKSEGIYTSLSFYFPLWFDIKPHYNLPGYDEINNKIPFLLLMIDEKMQIIYKSWVRQLFTSVNPCTGLTLAQDPAIGIVEIQNEDSFFFWTFTHNNVPEMYWKELEIAYGNWLQKKYGSLKQAFVQWGSAKDKQDDLHTGRVRIFEAWHMTKEGSHRGGPDKIKRIGDQVRFLTEYQREFYLSMVEYFRQDLGIQSLISPSNWHVTDGPMLDSLERYTYTAGDVIDQHGYFGGRHQGEGASYSVRVGHRFTNQAAVKSPEDLPIQVFSVQDYPHTISEIGWPSPNRFRADSTFLSSAYAALQGVDGLFFFSVSDNFLSDASMKKFTASSPMTTVTSPAAALQYRRGDVEEATDVFYQNLDLERLYAMKGTAGASAIALDEFRKQDLPINSSETQRKDEATHLPSQQLDPLTFYVGRVVRGFKGKSSPLQAPEKMVQPDLTQFINHQQKTVRSVTNQLFWDYDQGVVTVDTPKSQGVTGFIGQAGRIQLTDVTIASQNEFASIWVIALDDEPLQTSKRILVQTMTEEQPSGFNVDNGEIIDLGSPPIGIKHLKVTVWLHLTTSTQTRITVLDENGYRTESSRTINRQSGQPLVIKLDEKGVYHLIEK